MGFHVFSTIAVDFSKVCGPYIKYFVLSKERRVMPLTSYLLCVCLFLAELESRHLFNEIFFYLFVVLIVKQAVKISQQIFECSEVLKSQGLKESSLSAELYGEGE
jgi:hypothetical protein